tara:strand:+ start:1564 stop:2250 length:687 start_codon:yes stop_codon:yes gene_type:complete
MGSNIKAEILIELGTITTNTIEVLMDTDVAVVGFQFDIDGVDLTGGSGGIAEDNGFDVYASGNTALGFSLDGNEIPAGSSGLLTLLEGTINDTSVVCLPFVQNVGPEDDTPILADANGNALDNVNIGTGNCDSLSNDNMEISFSLFETYPNPFNPELNIDVAIEAPGNLNISIYNLTGQHIHTIYNDMAVTNKVYHFKWNASNVSSGIYIVQIQNENLQYSKVVNLLK